MSYRIGEEVLLTKLMGEEFDSPVRVKITSLTGANHRSKLLDYEVELKRVRSIDTGREVKDLKCWVREDWLAPAHIVIQESPEWPFD